MAIKPGHRLSALRWAGTAAAVALIVHMVDWRTSLTRLREADGRLILLALALYFAGVGLKCLKWRLLLRALGLHAPFLTLARWYLIGSFASNFLPSDIGGDVGRAFVAGRALGYTGRVVLSIFLERLLGMVGLLLVALVGAWLAAPIIGWPRVAPALLGICGIALMVAAYRWRKSLLRMLPARIAGLLAGYEEEMARMGSALPAAVALAAGFHLLSAVIVWIDMLAVGARAPLLPMLAFVPLVNLVSMIPVTINGWGMREGTYMWLLKPLGISTSLVLAGTLLTRAVVLLGTLAGAPLALSETYRTGKECTQSPVEEP